MSRTAPVESFLDRLTPRLESLSKGQRSIADLLVREFDAAGYRTAADVAERTGVSESTVVRFAQALGYEGYLELRQAMAGEAQQRIGKQARFLRAPARSSAALLEVARQDSENIERMLATVDEAKLEAAVQLFAQARTRILIGRGISHHMATLLGYLLFLVGVPNVAGHASDLSIQVAALDPGDLLVAFSVHPYSRETLDATSYAKAHGVPVLAFTDRADSPIAALADTLLLVPGENVMYSHSSVAFNVLANALVTVIGSRDPGRALQRVREAEQVNRPAFRPEGMAATPPRRRG
jgi:DNA-binding MurR/RpiR family transcriptional regulator